MNVFSKLVITGLVAVAAIVGTSAVRVNPAVAKGMGSKDDVTAYGYYHMGVVPDTIVYDLWDVRDTASIAGVIGNFFRFAEEMSDREFSQVRMAFKGETVFVLDGEDFRKIGREHAFQNPVYLVRTFPEKLMTPDGDRAFSEWTGGLIGVLNAQMDDVNEMGRQWFVSRL